MNNIADDGGIQSIIDVLKTNNTLKTWSYIIINLVII